MTDKQSTVVVSRELSEEHIVAIASEDFWPEGLTVVDVWAAFLDLLDATSEQAVDVGEPVAWLDEESGAIVTEKLKHVLCEDGFEIPLYRHAQPPAKSGPWESLSAPGQIKLGDWLHFTVGGKFICTKAKEILEAGTHREEVVYNRSRNHYFITGMAVDGTSSHKGVMIAKP